MGFFDEVKKEVGKFTKVVKEGANQLVNEIQEKPQFYQYVDDLLSEIRAVQKDKNLAIDPEMEKALQDFKVSLKHAMHKFDRETRDLHSLTGPNEMSARVYNKAFHEFCETSVNAIHKYQPTLMAAPGIWNRLKACINNVLEEYLGIENALKVDDSNVAASGEFRNRFDKVKVEGRVKMDEIEEHPSSPNIK